MKTINDYAEQVRINMLKHHNHYVDLNEFFFIVQAMTELVDSAPDTTKAYNYSLGDDISINHKWKKDMKSE